MIEDAARRGLARNPSTPAGVLLRLLGTDAVAEGLGRHPGLPPEVAEAMLGHPSARIRAADLAGPAPFGAASPCGPI